MLSRGASNASLRPQGSKSTLSLKPQAAHSSQRNTEPETLHQDAVTAANLAYERAKGRTIGQNGAIRGEGEKDPNKASDVLPGLGRRQSVRFVGQNAVPLRTRSITRREAPDQRTSHECSLQSSPVFPADSSLISNEDVVTSLPEDFDEVYVASEPSSYRRLRKAKSMFSPGKGPSSFSASGKPNSKGYRQRRSLQCSDATGEPVRVPDPRLKRSYSFLRGVTDKLSSANGQYANHDAAIQFARDTYLQQVERQRLKEQISFLHLGRRPKTQKAFRRTVRTSSTNSYGSAVASPLSVVEVKQPGGLGSKARTISQTWREKLKRVFRRPSGGLSVPVQHLDATHAHYGDPAPTSRGSAQPFPSFPEPNAPLLRRVGSRESSLHREPFIVSESLRPGSVRSLSSDEEAIQDKSRVTSWTNSTAANTVNLSNFIERKRLSMIKEDGGPHQSSSSLRADGSSNLYATFQQPVKQVGPGRVETKRIFSALRKEIDQNSRKVTEENCDSGTNSDFDLQKSHQSFATSGRRPSDWPGIRRVSTTREPTRQSRNPSSGISGRTAVDNVDCTQGTHSRIDSQQNYEEIEEGLTPQEIANMNESSNSIFRPLREVKSAFFPPSMRIERSNVSPFRRAMYAGSRDEDSATRSGYVDQQALVGSRMHNGSVARSESVYSRSSSDPMSKAALSSLSLPESESSGKAGTAIIITSRSSTQEPSVKPFLPQKYSSAGYSGDWKKFLASQVASLESTGRTNMINDISVKERGHKKEDAQIDEDDVSVGTLRTPDLEAKQPLGIIQGNSVGCPRSAGEKISSSNQYFTKGVKSRQNENSPVTPFSMSSQQRVSTGNGLPYSGFRQGSFSALREKPSQASLNSQDSTKASTTKTPRLSPQRAERVRRLKSSSSATLGKTPSGNGNRAVNDPRDNAGHELDDADISPINIQTHAGKNQKLVDSFLRGRRSTMRISEESSTDPAFL